MGRTHEGQPRLVLLARIASIVIPLAIGATGCAREGSIPRTLVDGSPARAADVTLDGVDGPVLVTRTSSADLQEIAGAPGIESCLLEDWNARPAPPIVHRVATVGESVTFASALGRTLQACDGSGTAAGSRSWCGHAFGRLGRRGLLDPRLDLGGCRTDDGRPIAFVWIDPGPDTSYVVVRRHGFSEAYETAAGLPVRVAVTERIDVARSGAVVKVSEHSADGRELRASEVEAFVSG